MGPIDGVNHLLNFVPPALALALCMAGPARMLDRRSGPRIGFWRTFTVQLVLGVLVLLGGLTLFGHDGKMASYALLALCSGTAQWTLDRGWRR